MKGAIMSQTHSDKVKERMFSNVVNGTALGAILFFGGLFVTIASYGFASPIGLPMMIVGLALPFWEAYRAKEGRNWIGSVRTDAGSHTVAEP